MGRALLGVIVGVSTVGCSGAPAEPGASASRTVAASSPTRAPLLTQRAGTRGGGTAGVDGTVDLDARGCWMLNGEYNVVWPEDTRWADDAQAAVMLPNGDLVSPGDRVSGMGSWWDGPAKPSGAGPTDPCIDSRSPRVVNILGAERDAATNSSSQSSSGT